MPLEEGTQKQTFRIQDFEGPLDLLLFLIKKNEVNIYDIPIAQVTEQYVSYLNDDVNRDLDNLTDFYLMAATLLYIKSRMLLPVEIDLDDELGDPRKELVERLIEYQRFKKLSDLMIERNDDTDVLIERRGSQRTIPFGVEDPWQDIEVWDLLKSFSSVMAGLTSEKIINLYEEVSVNEKISLIYELLEEHEHFSFQDLITKQNSVMELVCAFLAVLETVKMRQIRIQQHVFFGDIRIIRREDAADFTIDESIEEEGD